eukprot:Clim_evm18s172 gene=Clim_evmTU18s172
MWRCGARSTGLARQVLQSAAIRTPVSSVQFVSRARPTGTVFRSAQVNQFRGIITTRVLREVKDIKVPTLADSITEGELSKWEVAVGEYVAGDDVLAVVETDKVDIEINAPFSGVVTEHLAAEGDTIQVDQVIAKIDTAKGPSEGAAKAPKEEAPAAEAPQEEAPAAEPPKAEAPKAEAPKPAEKPAPKKEAPKPAAPPAAAPADTGMTGAREERRVKMTRLRMKVAERLKDAQNTYAMLTTFNEIDMSGIMALRKKHQEAFVQKYGIKLGFMSIFVAASAQALKEQPVLNAVIDGNEIVYRDYVDVSVAVSTPKGLVVPVLRNCESMNLAEIEMGIAELGRKARDGDLAIEDMTGGTFTISNGGVYGSLMTMPIINPPQSSILGMAGTFDRPVAINKEVVVRPMMYVGLTYDHRLIDGREAVMALRKIKAIVEDPFTLLIDL